MEPLCVKRLPIKFSGDDRWVIARPFFPGGETRVRRILDRIGNLSDEEVERLLSTVIARFEHRHHDIEAVFREHSELALSVVGDSTAITERRSLLVGSYFTMEYPVASTALFNPSIVAHPDQSCVPDGDKRFIMSLRATGEGHISSIVFRTGTVTADQEIYISAPGQYPRRARQCPDRLYEKSLFRRKLEEMVVDNALADSVMSRLPEYFTFVELEHAIDQARNVDLATLRPEETTDSMEWLARENYELSLPKDADISDVVIFPQSDNESRGIEDLRLVAFVDDDGSVTYIGTYSAYNGYRVLPQILETNDFHTIRIHTLNGKCAQNKGMALFPRRIDGHYVMCSRIDGENLYIMYSDILQFWETAEMLRMPKYSWEFVQVGNCGSPLETPEGWLLLTHGVGPMRSYCIGAMLLDLKDPLRVIGHLAEPLIVPDERERDGNVPNVVYTCGATIHDDYLYVPYAMSDSVTGFAVVALGSLLERLLDNHK